MSAIQQLFPAAPVPSSLAHYRLLSPLAGVRVSPLCLGAMNFGNNWEAFMGEITKDEAFKIMDTFYEAGGNFIDTANNYQKGESEEWIGEWMKKRNNRNEIVLATKFTSLIPPSDGPAGIKINHIGNSSKSLHISVRESLKRLQTDYIDVLYLHWWDYTTSIEEVMQSLNHLVVSGKVLYLGVSDTPAWIVSAANTYAKEHGLAQFVVYQGRWNALQREVERDVLPMARSLGLAMAPWNVLKSGVFARFADQGTEGKGRSLIFGVSDNDHKVLEAISVVARQLNSTPGQIAIAYVMHKFPNTYPIIGGRKATHLADNIKALDIKLTPEQLKGIEDAVPFDIGFPHDFIGSGLNPQRNHVFIAVGGKIVSPAPHSN